MFTSECAEKDHKRLNQLHSLRSLDASEDDLEYFFEVWGENGRIHVVDNADFLEMIQTTEFVPLQQVKAKKVVFLRANEALEDTENR